MKFRLAILVFILIPISLFSQKTVIEKNIDSLAFEISNNAENDIALSNELAFLLIHSGRIHEAKSMLTKTILQEFKHGISDTAAYLQAIDLYGEIYYYLRDFNKAMDIWSQNYQIKKKYFGTESIFLAESYCKFAKFHNFKIDIDTAFYYAEKAKMMLKNAEENQLVLINVPEILKTYAYAYKISFSRVYNNNDNRISCFLKVTEILDSAISYQHPLNIYYEADYVHDKANCYTDMVCFLYCEKIIPDHPFISLLYCKQEALSLYSEEYAIRNKVNNNPLFMIRLFFTKALVTGYASNDTASIKNCISYCDSAIAIASKSYSNCAYDNILQENLLIANTLGVRHFKSSYLKTLYQNDTTNIDYLYRMHENAKQSFDSFIQLLNALHSQKLGSLFQRYNMLQFDLLYYADMELFRQTNDTAYLEMALIHSQFSKNLDIAQAKFKGYPISPVYFPPALEKWKEYTKNNPKTVVIDYFIFVNKISIILLKNGKISHHYVETAINENYYAFVSEIKQINENTFHCLANLYDDLIKPIESEINEAEKLIIIPYQHLALIPFDALIADINAKDTYLSGKYKIQSIYSLFINSLEKESFNRIKMGVFSPEYHNHAELPFNKETANCFMQEYKADSLDFEQILIHNEAYALHISAHGKYDSLNRESAIFINDTALVFGKEFNNLSNPPVLASFISCQSATGKEMGYEGIESIARSFAIAGTRTIVAGTWELDDKASSIIMDYFYANLAQEISVHEAMRQAKMQFKKEYPEMKHPFYWAGIQVVGDDLIIAIEKRPNKNRIIWLSLAFLLLLAVLLFYRKRIQGIKKKNNT
jgi:CHAT domain-containing protein